MVSASRCGEPTDLNIETLSSQLVRAPSRSPAPSALLPARSSRPARPARSPAVRARAAPSARGSLRAVGFGSWAAGGGGGAPAFREGETPGEGGGPTRGAPLLAPEGSN